MPLIKCTHCGASGNAPDHVLGSQVRCSKCKQSFIASVGAAAPAAPPPDDVPEEVRDEDEDRDERDDDDDDDGFEDRPRRRSSHRERDDDDDDDDDDDRREIRIRRPTSGGVGDLLTFRKLLGRSLVQIVFWLGIAGVFFMAIVVAITAAQGGGNAAAVGLLVALVYALLLPIFIRLYSEVAAAIFTMNETLIEIRDELRRKD